VEIVENLLAKAPTHVRRAEVVRSVIVSLRIQIGVGSISIFDLVSKHFECCMCAE